MEMERGWTRRFDSNDDRHLRDLSDTRSKFHDVHRGDAGARKGASSGTSGSTSSPNSAEGEHREQKKEDRKKIRALRTTEEDIDYSKLAQSKMERNRRRMRSRRQKRRKQRRKS